MLSDHRGRGAPAAGGVRQDMRKRGQTMGRRGLRKHDENLFGRRVLAQTWRRAMPGLLGARNGTGYLVRMSLLLRVIRRR